MRAIKIRYLSIEHGNTSDAPFIGARISAIRCNLKCPGCFNTELNFAPLILSTVAEVLAEVQEHPINQGIILGGLEWTEQPGEMRALVIEAIKAGLKVMLYTGLTEQEFTKRFPDFYNIDGEVYIKFGRYVANAKGYKSPFDVYLKSLNQHIVKLEGAY